MVKDPPVTQFHHMNSTARYPCTGIASFTRYSPSVRMTNTPLANTLYYGVGEMEGGSSSILKAEGAIKRRAEENVLFYCSYTFNTPFLYIDAGTSNCLQQDMHYIVWEANAGTTTPLNQISALFTCFFF